MKLIPLEFGTAVSVGGLLVLLLAASTSISSLRAQGYMNDGSSTYLDGWGDSSYMYGYGSTSGSIPIHEYAVDVTITSPLGRTSSASSTSYRSGIVSKTAMLSWNWNDYGDYTINTTHKGFCTISYYYFILAQRWGSRQPPNPPCQDQNSATCKESNQLAPLGPRRGGLDCKRSTNCCTANLIQINGWCRTETCYKCSGQPNDPVQSQCFQREDTCKDKTFNVFCGTTPCQ